MPAEASALHVALMMAWLSPLVLVALISVYAYVATGRRAQATMKPSKPITPPKPPQPIRVPAPAPPAASGVDQQLLLVVTAILDAALERLQESLSHAITQLERTRRLRHGTFIAGDEPVDGASLGELIPEERAIVDHTGAVLAVRYAGLTDEGVGPYDALTLAGHVHCACSRLVSQAWASPESFGVVTLGKTIPGHSGDLWPDVTYHARSFIDACRLGPVHG